MPFGHCSHFAHLSPGVIMKETAANNISKTTEGTDCLGKKNRESQWPGS